MRFWEASVDMRRRKVIWMLTSSGREPSLPYSNCARKRRWEKLLTELCREIRLRNTCIQAEEYIHIEDEEDMN